jgi:hypothetical protein
VSRRSPYVVTVAESQEPRRKRLDELAGPGWVGSVSSALRGGGVLAALLLLVLGFLTGGFFLLLTGALAAVALVGGWLLASFINRESWWGRPNARAASIVIALAFPIALVAIAQLAGPLLTPEPGQSHCFSGQLARDEQREEALAVDPRITRMEFRLEVPVLREGALRWWITDPSGVIQWGGRVEEEGHSATEDVAPAGGRWTMTVLSEADAAEFRLEWHGAEADTPLDSSPACPPVD